MIKPLHVLPELRFPKRLERVRKLGVEIAESIGKRVVVGGGTPTIAQFEDFRFLYFTPFNQPRQWPNIDWNSNDVRLYLHGLSIGYDRGYCLSMFWDKNGTYVQGFRNPSEDNWDRRLGRRWKKYCRGICRTAERG